jgi:hypothetical protein
MTARALWRAMERRNDDGKSFNSSSRSNTVRRYLETGYIILPNRLSLSRASNHSEMKATMSFILQSEVLANSDPHGSVQLAIVLWRRKAEYHHLHHLQEDKRISLTLAM